MKNIEKGFEKILNNLLVVSLMSLCIIVFLNVILRSIFTSLTWTVEVSRFIFVYNILLASIIAMKENSHFVVDILVSHLPLKVRKILTFIGNLLILFSLYIILIGSWKLVIINKNAATAIAKIPQPLLYGAGVITALLMGIFVLKDIVNVFLKEKNS